MTHHQKFFRRHGIQSGLNASISISQKRGMKKIIIKENHSQTTKELTIFSNHDHQFRLDSMQSYTINAHGYIVEKTPWFGPKSKAQAPENPREDPTHAQQKWTRPGTQHTQCLRTVHFAQFMGSLCTVHARFLQCTHGTRGQVQSNTGSCKGDLAVVHEWSTVFQMQF